MKSGSQGNWLLLLLMSVLLIVAFVLLAVWVGGSVSGRELDVVTWDMRSFSYTRNPLTGNQLSDIQHENLQSAADAIIHPHLLGGPLCPATSRWDLLQIQTGTQAGRGDASILLDYLSAYSSRNDSFWADWTTKYPAAAPILWSAVRDLAHISRYDRLPALFEVARVTTDAQQLKPKVAAVMVEAMEEASSACLTSDKPRAIQIAKAGLGYGRSVKLEQLVEDQTK